MIAGCWACPGKEVWFIDTVLPFGLRSAPKIFNSVADALAWIVLRAGVSKVLHYLDDFLVAKFIAVYRGSLYVAVLDGTAGSPSGRGESNGTRNMSQVPWNRDR